MQDRYHKKRKHSTLKIN